MKLKKRWVAGMDGEVWMPQWVKEITPINNVYAIDYVIAVALASNTGANGLARDIQYTIRQLNKFLSNVQAEL